MTSLKLYNPLTAHINTIILATNYKQKQATVLHSYFGHTGFENPKLRVFLIYGSIHCTNNSKGWLEKKGAPKFPIPSSGWKYIH